MKKLQIVVASLVVITMLIVACAPQAAPAPAAAPQVPAVGKPAAPAPVAAPSKPAWQEQWDKVVEAGKKEGKVVVYSGAGAEVRSVLLTAFPKAFPGISVEVVSDRGSRLALKIETERRAKLYLADIFLDADTPPVNQLKPIGALAPLEPAFILPELTEPEVIKKTWWRGELFWLDKTRTILGMQLNPDIAIAINTNLVKAEEAKSWNVLLDPKWKGKIAMFDPTRPGAASSFAMFTEEVMGPGFLAELVKNQPIILDQERQAMEWLAFGKVAIVIAPSEDDLSEFMRAGAPITAVMPKEGAWMGTGSGCVSLVDKAPHPNAAKVFINWLLSKEGNTLFVRAYGQQSLRLDVPTDHLLPQVVRQEGVNYWIKSTEERLEKFPEGYKRWGAIMAPVLKR